MRYKVSYSEVFEILVMKENRTFIMGNDTNCFLSFEQYAEMPTVPVSPYFVTANDL